MRPSDRNLEDALGDKVGSKRPAGHAREGRMGMDTQEQRCLTARSTRRTGAPPTEGGADIAFYVGDR